MTFVVRFHGLQGLRFWRLAIVVVMLLSPITFCVTSGVVQVSLTREGVRTGAEKCPPIEITLEMRREHREPARCGCGPEGAEKMFSAFSAAVPVPRSVSRLRSSIATLMLLASMFCLSTFFFANICNKSRVMKKAMKPVLGVIRQWAGDLSDVFVIFPWKGARLLLRLSVVVPLQALQALGFALRTARKLRLQRQLLAEADSQDDRPKVKQAKQSSPCTNNTNKAKQKKTGVQEKDKERRKENERPSEQPRAEPRTAKNAQPDAGNKKHSGGATGSRCLAGITRNPERASRNEELTGTCPEVVAMDGSECAQEDNTEKVVQPACRRQDTVDTEQAYHPAVTVDEQVAPATTMTERMAEVLTPVLELPATDPEPPRLVATDETALRGKEHCDSSSQDEAAIADTTSAAAHCKPEATPQTVQDPNPCRELLVPGANVPNHDPSESAACEQTTHKDSSRRTAPKESSSTEPAVQRASSSARSANRSKTKRQQFETPASSGGDVDEQAVEKKPIQEAEPQPCKSSILKPLPETTVAPIELPAPASILETDDPPTPNAKVEAALPQKPDAEAALPQKPDAEAALPKKPDVEAALPKKPDVEAALPKKPDVEAALPQKPDAEATPSVVASAPHAETPAAPPATTPEAHPALPPAAPTAAGPLAPAVLPPAAPLLETPSAVSSAPPAEPPAEPPAAPAATPPAAPLAVPPAVSTAAEPVAPPVLPSAAPLLAEPIAESLPAEAPPAPRARADRRKAAAQVSSDVLTVQAPPAPPQVPPPPPASMVEPNLNLDVQVEVCSEGTDKPDDSRITETMLMETQQGQEVPPPVPPPPPGCQPMTSQTYDPAPVPLPLTKSEKVEVLIPAGAPKPFLLPEAVDPLLRHSNLVEKSSGFPAPPSYNKAPQKQVKHLTPEFEFPDPGHDDIPDVYAAQNPRRLPRNLGPPPPGPAPHPPAQTGIAGQGLPGHDSMGYTGEDMELDYGVTGYGVGPTTISESASMGLFGRSEAEEVFGMYSGWNTGGTGGTVDFGWNSEAVIHMMEQQAKMQASREMDWQSHNGVHSSFNVPSSAVTTTSSASIHDGVPSSNSRPIVEDDVGQRLEAMVEELAGVDSFALLEDAFSKVDAAREALSKVVGDSNLRHSAPAFVPGQPWTGSQQSCFVD